MNRAYGPGSIGLFVYSEPLAKTDEVWARRTTLSAERCSDASLTPEEIVGLVDEGNAFGRQRSLTHVLGTPDAAAWQADYSRYRWENVIFIEFFVGGRRVGERSIIAPK